MRKDVLKYVRYVIDDIHIKIQLIVFLFLALVLPLFAVGVETHPVWKEEVFQSYPEILELRTLQYVQRTRVRVAIGKLHIIVSNFDQYFIQYSIVKFHICNILRIAFGQDS